MEFGHFLGGLDNGGLLGAGVGGGTGAAIGGLSGGALGALLAYLTKKQKNENIVNIIRTTPGTATYGDYLAARRVIGDAVRAAAYRP